MLGNDDSQLLFEKREMSPEINQAILCDIELTSTENTSFLGITIKYQT